jgi:sigma-E factor negative regulatory protein RseC
MSGLIEARAEVVRAEAGRVWVRLTGRQGGCGRCHEPGGCGETRLTDVFRGGARDYVIDDPLGLAPGERVKLVIGAGVPLRAALSSYGLGTVLILLGGALGAFLASPAWIDLGTGTGAALGGMLAALHYRFTLRHRLPRLAIVRDERPCAAREGGMKEWGNDGGRKRE